MADNEAGRAKEIARLNDDLRRTFEGGEVLTTRGLAGLEEATFCKVMFAVMEFDEFTSANDPLGEHDFGLVTVDGVRVIWKIDYYDQTKKLASLNPASRELTTRVLAIMLAEEY